MKFSMATLFLVTLFICLSVKYASSIECYVCDSMSQPDCLDNYSSLKPKTCPGKDICGISKMTLIDGKEHIERKCAKKGKEDHGEEKSPLGTVAWSTCDTDLCNWGVMNKSHMMTLVVSAMLSLCFYFKF